MDTGLLRHALRYKHWADLRTVDAIKGIDQVLHVACAAFARQQLNHMVIVEELFKARLLGQAEPHRATNTQQIPELDDLATRLASSNQWLMAYADGLDELQGARCISFQFTDGQHGSLNVLEILFHLVNHGTYHRGAIGHALDLAQAVRPADTYTVFIHGEEPQRRVQP